MDDCLLLCVGRCKTLESGFCRGCWRTDEEVLSWRYLSEEEKQEIQKKVEKRRKNDLKDSGPE